MSIGIRDPVERVLAICRDPGSEARREMERLGWSLSDVYRELSGGKPGTSETHARFEVLFNGQARAVLAGDSESPKMDYWAGMPERGAALRDESLAILTRDRVSAGPGAPATALDPETRLLLLAHNQVDAELHAYFAGLAGGERARPRPLSPAPQRTAVCVLGMSRSGTSLTARILNLLGVDLGDEEELMPPRAGNNPAGFWEHKGIADLNEEILATLSDSAPPYLQGWRWPPDLAPGWERDARLAPCREAAQEMLSQGMSVGHLWGWKDPRNSLTLPFWQLLVPDLRHVVCVRHPLDVAASLGARDSMPRGEALALWQRYMTAALEHTEGRPRLFVAYDAYFADWERQVDRLAGFLDMPEPDELDRAEIVVNIEPGLHHHREASDAAGDLPAAVAELYARLVELSSG